MQPRRLAAATLIMMAGCGHASTTSPTPSSTLVGPYSLQGVVVDYPQRRPVPGATIDLVGSGTATVTTDSAGRFSVPSVSEGLLIVTLRASGYLDRVTRFSVTRSRSDVTIDMISNAEPFSLDYYRQFARGVADPGTLHPTNPWTSAPFFYIRSVTEDSGERVPDAVVRDVQRVIEASILELSGGRLIAGGFDVGEAPWVKRAGWVPVGFYHSIGVGLSGQATIGPSPTDSGYIHLLYDPALDEQGFFNPGHCLSIAVTAAEHEIVHTMGFYHPLPDSTEFRTGPGCPGTGRAARLRYHADVMYARPSGNVDVDRDPPAFFLPLSLRDRSPVDTVVQCRLPNGR
jgi:hypothetical protein